MILIGDLNQTDICTLLKALSCRAEFQRLNVETLPGYHATRHFSYQTMISIESAVSISNNNEVYVLTIESNIMVSEYCSLPSVSLDTNSDKSMWGVYIIFLLEQNKHNSLNPISIHNLVCSICHRPIDWFRWVVGKSDPEMPEFANTYNYNMYSMTSSS